MSDVLMMLLRCVFRTSQMSSVKCIYIYMYIDIYHLLLCMLSMFSIIGLLKFLDDLHVLLFLGGLYFYGSLFYRRFVSAL